MTTPKLGLVAEADVCRLAVVPVTTGVVVVLANVVCAGDPTVNVVLTALLLGFGSFGVDTDQVNVWVPDVAVHGADAVTVAGTPPGPGYETEPPPQLIPSTLHSTSMLCGKAPDDDKAAICIPNIT
jgi:hypothetical protein